MIRLGYLIDSLQTGGTELNAVRLAESLDRKRFTLFVAHLHPSGPLLPRFQALGVPLAHIPLGRLYAPTAVTGGLMFMRWLLLHRIQLLHTHDIYSNVFGVPWAKAAGLRPVIASRRWWRSEHRRALLRLNTIVSRWAGHVLCNSSTIATEVVAATGLPPSSVRYIPNFVEAAAFDEATPAEVMAFREGLGISSSELVLGVVARLAAVKEHTVLLRALAILDRRGAPVQLIVAGEGPLRETLGREASTLGIAHRVHFLGELPNRPNPHRLFDVSVLPSRSEGFPNSLLEAMAAGRPVIATRVGGIPDLVVHGETGLLVPPQEPEQMAIAIEQLSANPTVVASMGRAGRRRASTTFDHHRVVAELESWYESLVAGESPPP